jgi:membrane-associated phospholipid phosphatase
VQNGAPIPLDNLTQYRYPCTARDMANWVHVDALFQGYLNATLLLLGLGAPLNPGNPYITSTTQIGFATFGNPAILTLVTEVATRALKAEWYQKWFVHRRIRPEAYGSLVHLKLTGVKDYPLNHDVLNSAVIPQIFSHNAAVNAANGTGPGTYLLPMAFPEGSPQHPAYGSGHATVAGACVTILKAWFDGSWELPNPVEANADGTALVPYTGTDVLTVEGELNKLAGTIGLARGMAGVHWRSDYWQAALLGEQVAIGILREQKLTYNEPTAFQFTTLEGQSITI